MTVVPVRAGCGRIHTSPHTYSGRVHGQAIMLRKLYWRLPAGVRRLVAPAIVSRLESLRYDLAVWRGWCPIVVFQMGRVGSRSVYETLVNARLRNPIYHIHVLTPERLDMAECRYRDANAWTPFKHVARSRMLAAKRCLPGRTRWKIVTLVRDPVRTFVSQVFGNPRIYVPFLLDAAGDVREERAVEYVMDSLASVSDSANYVLSWFDTEFALATGVNVYELPFVHEKGFSIVEGPRDDILILRLEDLARVAEPAMQQWLGTSRAFPLVTTNVNHGRRHSHSYQAVLNKLRLPRELLERVYACQYAAHFYSPTEREQLVSRWSGTASAPGV